MAKWQVQTRLLFSLVRGRPVWGKRPRWRVADRGLFFKTKRAAHEYLNGIYYHANQEWRIVKS